MRISLRDIWEAFKTPASTVGLIALFFGAFLVMLWALICLVRLVMG